MRYPQNILEVAQSGADWIGFIFYPKSKRYFAVEEEYQLPVLKPQVKKVGVFVNASPDEMMAIALRHQLDYLQLHGNESPEMCHALQKRGYALIKALPIATMEDIKQTQAYEGRVDYFLFDTKCESYGGSGKSFDWSILSAYKGETPFLLSGGIHPDSLERIKNVHHPAFAGIDLNSGFEKEPGLKDINKLSGFIAQLKNNH